MATPGFSTPLTLKGKSVGLIMGLALERTNRSRFMGISLTIQIALRQGIRSIAPCEQSWPPNSLRELVTTAGYAHSPWDINVAYLMQDFIMCNESKVDMLFQQWALTSERVLIQKPVPPSIQLFSPREGSMFGCSVRISFTACSSRVVWTAFAFLKGSY
jgi:hypothetical protein